ncbi:MAG TPA: glycosyltransferase, partial [Candidatus Pristimantibacillus sp.]|nr:glycosyltransferase [Candidatus Pristimantibacillus sp.]
MKILMLGSGSVKSNFMYRLLALGKALHRRGHEVSIIAPKADKYNNFTPENINAIDGVRVLQPFQFATKRLEINLLPYLFGAARLVLREKPDLVYVYKPTPISVVGFIAKLRGIPVVLDMDDLGSEVMRVEGHPLYMRKLVERCEKFALRRADALVMASTLLSDTYAKAFPKKPVLWLPNGVESGWFGKVLPRKRKYQIVFFGALNRKNIVEPLFDVLPKIIDQYPAVHVLLIGDGKHMSYFKAKAEEMGIGKHITFTGWLQLDSAHALLRAGDIGYNYMPDELTVRAA